MRFILLSILFPFSVFAQKGKSPKKKKQQTVVIQKPADDGTNQYSNDKVFTSLSDIVFTKQQKNITGNEKVNKPLIVILKNNGQLVAFDLATKKESWKYTFTDQSTNKKRNRFQIEGGVMYATSEQKELVALDVNDGTLFWRSKIGNQKSDRSYMINGQHLPIQNNLIFLASCNNQLYTFNKLTGQLVWNYRLQFEYNLYSPMVCNNTLVITNAPWVYCFEANTGKPLWQKGFGSEAMYACIRLDSTRAYVAGERNIIYALNLLNQANIDWQFETEKEQSQIGENTLLAAQSYFFATTKGRDSAASVYCLETANGKLKWRTTLRDGDQINTFFKSNDYLLGFSNAQANYFFMLDANTGKHLDIPSPKESAISNVVKLDAENMAFITAHYFVQFNIISKAFSYADLQLNDNRDPDFNIHMEIANQTNSN
jgi:outer membrane protein assembly factor BamB